MKTSTFTFALLLTAMSCFSQTWEQLPYYYPQTTQSSPKIFASPNDVLVAGFNYKSAPASHISLNEGATWQQIFADKPIATVEFGPDGNIYFIATKRYLTTSNYYIDTLFRSSDGISWTNMGYKLKGGSNEYDFTISGNNTLLFPKFSDINGVFFSASADNAQNWSNLLVPEGPVTCSHTADTIISTFSSPWPGGIRYSHDGGATVNTSTGISAGGTIPVMLPNGDIYAAAVGKIFKSTDGGVSFSQIPLNSSVVQIQEFMYGSNGKFYIRVLNGIWETSDFTNVTAITSNLPDYNSISDMDISNNYIYAITDTNLYRYPLSMSTSSGPATAKENSLKIYPNPSSDILYLSVSPNVSILEAELMDQIGKVAARSGSGEISINTSLLPQGIYYLRVNSDAGEFRKKVIIVR